MPEPAPKESATPPAPTLTELLLGLAAAALNHLGHRVAPEGPEPQVNMAMARHTIDTIELLKVKTAGNRTREEDELFETILYQLRMACIEVNPAGAGTGPPPAAES
uniref:DUF1844 domain-containing protein n=1 Tax=candidate division WOR-3 bacterium TaxID=2052148 RepID=A0A7C4CCD9_UNCW3